LSNRSVENAWQKAPVGVSASVVPVAMFGSPVELLAFNIAVVPLVPTVDVVESSALVAAYSPNSDVDALTSQD